MNQVVIIGDGAAGTTAAYYVRRADSSARIHIISDDPNPAYYRAALTNYLIGELREEQLFAVPPDFYHTQNVQRTLGWVAEVDSTNARIRLADGTQMPYDHLLIGAGASPNPPRFEGAEIAGVMTMRTLQDVRTVIDQIKGGGLRQAVVIGGGPLGIEWVHGLLTHGVHVTYLLREEMFFKHALDRTASDLVISRLRADGVDVRLNEEIEAALPDQDGRLQAVRLKNSQDVIECQLVGAAIGIRPNVGFLENSGIEISRDEKRGTAKGIPVDETMRTNVPNVYAAGDIITGTTGLWEPARLQGRVAGQTMMGGSASYQLGIQYNATRLGDLDFASAGVLADQPGDQVMVDFPQGSGRIAYRKLIIRDGMLAGVLLLGHREEKIRKHGRLYQKLIQDQIDISSVTDHLLDRNFDLPGWLDNLTLGEQIASARSIAVMPVVSSPAEIRRAKPDKSLTSLVLPTAPPAVQAGPVGLPEAPMSMSLLMTPDSPGTLWIGEQSYEIQSKSVMVGRDAQADISLADPAVSYLHAQIMDHGGGLYLRDLGSRNGTYANGEQVTTPYMLHDGDEIRVGSTSILFSRSSTMQPQRQAAFQQRPPENVVYQLVVQSGPMSGTSFTLQGDSLAAGRDPAGAIALPDQSVSWEHARFEQHGGQWLVQDLNSRNGIKVNDERLDSGDRQRISLGDRIQLGSIILEYVQSTAAQATDSAVPTSSLSPGGGDSQQAYIRVLSGKLTGQLYELSGPVLMIGRGSDNDIPIPDDSVSRQHARLTFHSGSWHITDLNSANGTWVNQNRIGNVEIRLQNGDRLQLGSLHLEFQQA